MPLTRRRFLASAAGGAGALALAGCSSGSSSGKTRLEFFQFKNEAQSLMDDLVAEFNAANPDLEVYQYNPADASSVIHVRLVKNNIPDIIGMNGDLVFGELATAGVFYDWSKEPILEQVQPAFASILPTLGVPREGEVNGVPFSNNADGLLLNKTQLEQIGADIPQTWDELIALADEFEAAGVPAFVWGLQETWTAAPMFNSIGATELGMPVADWYDKLRAGETSFAEAYPPVFEKMLKLGTYGNQKTKFSYDYNRANQEFSQGGVGMYAQGNFAIAPIRTFAPDLDVIVVPMPGTTAEQSRIVSGVDYALTMGVEPKHPAESKRFIEFLMSKKVDADYNDSMSMLPTLTGLTPGDDSLTTVVPAIEQGRLATFSDHNIPQSVNLNNYLQAFMQDGDVDGVCRVLDSEFSKVQKRQERIQGK